jgi:hypothetical protein
LKAEAATKMDVGARGDLQVHKVVGRPRIKEGREPSLVDDDEQLHCLSGAQMDARECVEGDGGVRSICRRLSVIVGVVDHIDAKQLLAHQLCPYEKNLVTVEALPILASLCDLGQR